MSNLLRPSEDDQEAIEKDLGMSHGAWDHLHPLDIINACWKRLYAIEAGQVESALKDAAGR